MTEGIWDRAAPLYEQTGVEFFAPLGRELVARAGLRRGDRVLDLGCGRGHVLVPAAEAVGAAGSVTGIDRAARMVSLTAAELRERGIVNAAVTVGDATAPSFAPGAFDAVLSGFMMFLLGDAAAALQAYRMLLSARGRIAFSTFGRADERHERARAVLRSRAGISPQRRGDGVFDDRDAIVRLVESSGFCDVTVCAKPVRTRFASSAQWWDWAWSVGLRGSLERIASERLDEARAEVEDVLAGARRPDGTLVLTTEILFTTATRPR